MSKLQYTDYHQIQVILALAQISFLKVIACLITTYYNLLHRKVRFR